MGEPNSVNQIDGLWTFSGTSSGPPPASMTRTLAAGFSLSRLATTDPAEPAPTTMKSYLLVATAAIHLRARRLVCRAGSSFGHRRWRWSLRERLGVVIIGHVDDLAVGEAEVVGALDVDLFPRRVDRFEVPDHCPLVAFGDDVLRVHQELLEVPESLDHVAQRADPFDVAHQLFVHDVFLVEERQPGIPVPAVYGGVVAVDDLAWGRRLLAARRRVETELGHDAEAVRVEPALDDLAVL